MAEKGKHTDESSQWNAELRGMATGPLVLTQNTKAFSSCTGLRALSQAAAAGKSTHALTGQLLVFTLNLSPVLREPKFGIKELRYAEFSTPGLCFASSLSMDCKLLEASCLYHLCI